MSAWTWEQQSSAADWMVIPTGQAGLGLQVPLPLPACLLCYVYYLVSTSLCLLPCVYYFVSTTLCPLPYVYRLWLCVSVLARLPT